VDGSGSARRGALRDGDIPTANVDAQTNPKAKMIPTIRYVHRKRISDRLSGSGDEIGAEKIAGPAVLLACCVNRAAERKPRRSGQVGATGAARA